IKFYEEFDKKFQKGRDRGRREENILYRLSWPLVSDLFYPSPSFRGTMRLVPRLRTKLQLLLLVESSFFMIGLAILFTLVSLVQPFWAFSRAVGVNRDIGSFGWVTFTADHYNGGVWSLTTILPYSSPAFSYSETAGVAGNVYVLEVVYLVVLGLTLGLFRFEFSRKMPPANLLILSLVVLGVALFALFYPIVAIPGAATLDIGTF